MKKLDVELHSETDLDTIVMVGKDMERIDKKGLASIDHYRADPKTWNIEKGYEWHGD